MDDFYEWQDPVAMVEDMDPDWGDVDVDEEPAGPVLPEAEVEAAAGDNDMGEEPDLAVSMDILPSEMLPVIFQFLPIHTRYLIQSVSRRWNAMSRYSISKQENLVVKTVRPSACRPHELPDQLLRGMSLRPAEQLIGLKRVKFWSEVHSMPSLVADRLARILKSSAESLTQVAAPSPVIAAFMHCISPVPMPAVRVLETDISVVRSLRFFPNLEKLILRSIDIQLLDSLPATVTCIDAASSRSLFQRRILHMGPMAANPVVEHAVKKYPWLLQLKEIRIPHQFSDEDIRTLISSPKVEKLCVSTQLNELSAGTISCLLRSHQKSLLISDPKMRMSVVTESDGTKVVTITEKNSLSSISCLIESSMLSSRAFRVTHSLSSSASEYELTFKKSSPAHSVITIRSSTFTNEEFKTFVDKLPISHSCSCLKLEVQKLVVGLNIVKCITSRFPGLQQLHVTVSNYVAKEMDQLLAMNELTDIIVRSTVMDVIPVPAAAVAAAELEGMAVIERMNTRSSPAKDVPAADSAASSSQRSVLTFDVPQYTADAIFFFTLATRNPYLEKIDVNISNFYGRNLSALQDLKYLKELNIRISSKLPLSVEMLGSILSGFRNKELHFSLKTFWERNEVTAEIQDYKLIRLSVTQAMDWESTQANNWPRLLSQFSSLIELELNGIGCGYNVIARNRRLKNLTWDKLDDEALVCFAEHLPQLECISCFENADVSTNGLMTLLRGKARECLRRVDVPMAGRQLNVKQLMEEVKVIQSVTNRKILLFIGE